MDELQEKEQPPLYVNRKASTTVFRENGKIYVREGDSMNDQLEIVKPAEPKKTVGSEPAGFLNGNENRDGSGNIDKIRDIIFGNQMQDYEKRFSRLEERLFKEMSESKSESKKSLASLDKYVSKEIEMLKDRIGQEQNSRTEAFKELSRQLKETTRSVEKKIDSLNDKLSDASNDLHQEISDLSQSLRNDIRLRYEEMSDMIGQAADDLRTNKVDRTSLSDFLTEMAMRISNDKG